MHGGTKYNTAPNTYLHFFTRGTHSQGVERGGGVEVSHILIIACKEVYHVP